MTNFNKNLIALFVFMVGFLAIANPTVLISTLNSVAQTLLPFVALITVLAGLQVTYKVIKK